jgi:hypothetical protein
MTTNRFLQFAVPRPSPLTLPRELSASLHHAALKVNCDSRSSLASNRLPSFADAPNQYGPTTVISTSPRADHNLSTPSHSTKRSLSNELCKERTTCHELISKSIQVTQFTRPAKRRWQTGARNRALAGVSATPVEGACCHHSIAGSRQRKMLRKRLRISGRPGHSRSVPAARAAGAGADSLLFSPADPSCAGARTI